METGPDGLEQRRSGVMFCQKCRQLLHEISSPHFKSIGIPRDHHESYLAYAEAVASGCRICMRLPFKDEEGDEWSLQCFPNTTHWIRLTFLLNGGMSRSVFILHALFNSGDLPPTTYKNTGSREALALSRQWLKTCVDNHLACNRLRPASLQGWNPTRLVFVGTQDDQALKLCEASAIHHRVTYLTLSHCWGTNLPTTVLTQHNRASWIREIPCSEMMQTFKDAIDVTRALGVQYLWIDSLCIMQDSPSDWLSESSKMSDVYKCSYGNIAAAHATSDAGGLFVDRKPPQILPGCFNRAELESEMLKEPVDGDQGGESFMGPYNDEEYFMAWNELRNSPLYKRAWVVQERILSPRILHFAGSQLFWECNDLRTCELFPGEMPRYLWSLTGLQDCKIFDFNRQSSVANYPSETLRPPASEGLRIWAKIVEAYAKCQLTKETDKLIAISAIARAMKPVMECRYLAGLWEKDLVKQLGWRIREGGRRPATYRAPSWSWASVESFCQPIMLLRDKEPLIEIRSVSIDLASGDEMGPVTGGYLDVTGQLFILKKISSGPNDYSTLENSGFVTSFSLNEDCSLTEIRGHVYLLPLTVSDPRDNSSDTSYTYLTALALQRCDREACYQRVGCIIQNLDCSDRSDTLFLEMLGNFKLVGRNDDDGPLWSFLRNDSRMQHLRLV